MGRPQRKRKTDITIRVEMLGPTPEQARDARFDIEDITDKLPGDVTVKIGKAYRRRPMIDTLADQGVFSDAEHKALRHYRHHADIADRSPVRDSLNHQRGGSGTGPTVEMLNAVRVRDDCERAAGSLVGILRAVVVDDMSLSQWAIRRYGSIEECEMRKGRQVCRQKPRDRALRFAKQDIQFAAKRVEAELNA
jgi:hypothetical protein